VGVCRKLEQVGKRSVLSGERPATLTGCRWMGILLGATLVGLALVSLAGFVSWRGRVLAQVRRGGRISETANGPVEFTMAGTGPVILQLHGGASGYDQTSALSWDLHEDGFAVLTPSRPGYLRTPLTTGASPEEAADAMAGLLDVLGIDRVCVMGTSGGGPTALQFALRHPGRVWGLVVQAAISQRHLQPRRTTNTLIGRVLFARTGTWPADFVAWGLHGLARWWPSLLIRSLLNASDDLDRSKAEPRRSSILRHPEAIAFFRRVVASGIPLSVRRTGLWNDLHQFAHLPVYPLERITCPTLVVHGRADRNVPLAHAEFVARSVPGAELFPLEDCGHFIWVGLGVAKAAAKVRDFLVRHAPPAVSERGQHFFRAQRVNNG
jgi:pimeloyl-ACP methyl ester carboxylesterase